MIKITEDQKYSLSLEIVSHELKDNILTINYNIISKVNDRKTTRSEILKVYCDLKYINEIILEEILEKHYK